jgi:secreted trypsin-like serine protease
MKLLKIALLCLTLTIAAFTSGCGGSKNSSSPDPRLALKGNGICIPESELLSMGIIGGERVNQEDYDSKLVVMLISGEGRLCTASAIAPNVLVTAAHCVRPDETVNAVFYSSLSCEAGFKRLENSVVAREVIINEAYKADLPEDQADKNTGDIALVVLKNNVPEGYPVYKIMDPQNITNGMDMWLYGYGRSDSAGGGAGILRKTKLSGNDYRVNMETKKVQIDQSHGSGICKGDSGGPALVEFAGQLQILGVHSYVNGPNSDICGDQAFDTLVFSYKDWINEKLKAVGAEPIR